MANSCMSVGKVMFMAVSMTTPVKERRPAAMMERKKRRSARRWNPDIDLEVGISTSFLNNSDESMGVFLRLGNMYQYNKIFKVCD